MAETAANHQQYQLDHIDEDKTPTIVAVYSFGFVCACSAVLLRFISRRVSNLPCLADDWTILAALVLFVALFGVDIWHVLGGQLGRHAIAVTAQQKEVFLKSLYVFNPLYTNIIPLVKISILLLYKRLFPLPIVHRIIYVLIALLVGFEISTTFVDIFTCRPIAAAWDKGITDAHCINPPTLYMATAGINLVTDIIILCLPMPLIWDLRLSAKRKFAVSLIFVLGSLVCIATTFRIATFHYINAYDLTWSYVETAYWTYTELVLAFICACVPTFTPVIQYFTRGAQALAERSSWKELSGHSNLSSQTDDHRSASHPPITFDSLGLARQQGAEVIELPAGGPVGSVHKVEAPYKYSAKAYSKRAKTPTGSANRGDDDDDDDIDPPLHGIAVQKSMYQTDAIESLSGTSQEHVV